MEREFTVEEANALLPELAPLIERLRRSHEAILRTARSGDGHAGNGTGSRAVAQAAAQRDYEAAIAALTAMQVVVRDAANGIVDFPARRDGEPVYLCWRPGEAAVGHWHSRDGGFAGRQPL